MFFVALLKNVPMGCVDSVLPQLLLKNHSVHCLLSKDHLCFFRALTMYLHAHSYRDAHRS